MGFNDNKVHEVFVKLIDKELGAFLAPKSLTSRVTPNDLWKLGKTIILGYADGTSVANNNFLWSNVDQVRII